VGDVANGARNRPFQVHSLNQAAILGPVCKEVLEVRQTFEIPHIVRLAFQKAKAGEPGPVGVVIPYNLLTEAHRYQAAPLELPALPADSQAIERALGLLANQ